MEIVGTSSGQEWVFADCSIQMTSNRLASAAQAEVEDGGRGSDQIGEAINPDQPADDPFGGKDLDALQDEFDDEEPRPSER